MPIDRAFFVEEPAVAAGKRRIAEPITQETTADTHHIASVAAKLPDFRCRGCNDGNTAAVTVSFS